MDFLLDIVLPFGMIVSAIAVAVVVAFLLVNLVQYFRAVDRCRLDRLLSQLTEELVKEKERVENVLSRMLPEQTACELQQTGRVSTERFNLATVLFADIEGFTLITDSVNAERLIDSLDRFFYDLDGIVERYHIEKIKTIGDAYMCAGGLPTRNRTNPVEVVLAALAMQHHMKHLNNVMRAGKEAWGLRIGVNTGPVISGVVGRDKLSYDIWGGAVNLASRMESSGEVGKVNISGNTYYYVQDFFSCTYRGAVPVKNKGNTDMYFVDGIRPELSVEGDGITPNETFTTRLQMVRLADVEEYVFGLLEKKLPKNLYYHNLKHTVDVYTQVELLGQREGISESEMLLVRTAALFHDAGHTLDYQSHEEMGVKIVCDTLPKFQYTDTQISRIASLIMATKMPVHPKTLLEEIICDADSDYLGRDDFISVANNLFLELQERGILAEERDWVALQIQYITQHRYFTSTARSLREANKQSQLVKLYDWQRSLQQSKR